MAVISFFGYFMIAALLFYRGGVCNHSGHYRMGKGYPVGSITRRIVAYPVISPGVTPDGFKTMKMETMIKAVFLDIDGTLVSFDTHRVPESAVKAVRELRAKGIQVFIATGRHMQFINNLGDMEFDGYITLNGSYCYAGRDRVIYKRGIADEDIRDLVRFLKTEEEFPCIFVRERDAFLNKDSKEVEKLLQLIDLATPPVKGVDEALRGEVYQLLAFFTPELEKRVMALLKDCEATRWTSAFADIVPAGGSKRIGMEKILEYFGIAREETIAFGDGGNDIPMLEYAGIGIAMGNTAEKVTRSADFVTRSVDDDGVEYALKHFGLL